MEFILIIDGNYILSKNVYILDKNKVLYGEFTKAMRTSFQKYVSLGTFSGIYFVSDSRGKSWRKELYDQYKATRTKDSNIDWEFVYGAYDSFKNELVEEEKAVVLESPRIEGDDWIHILTKLANKNGKSAFIISADGDLKQLLSSSISDNMMNVMLDDYVGRERFYVPTAYDIIKSNILEEPGDIFNIRNSFDIDSITNKYPNVIHIDNKKELFVKLLMGEKGSSSDNIPSVYETKSEKKAIGIGEKTAEKIYNLYIEDSNINENDETPVDIDEVANIVHTVRKIPPTETEALDSIRQKLKRNISLIHLHHKHIPVKFKQIISEKLKEYFKNEQRQYKEGRA